MWNYEKIGSEMALKMMLIDGVREPTLTQIQDNPEEKGMSDENLLKYPAWLFYSEPHPGLPEHYYTVSAYNQDTTVDDLPQVPFSLVDRVISYKVLVSLEEAPLNVPSLSRLTNGTIIITSSHFPVCSLNEIEMFLYVHEKLLPCFVTSSMSDIIIDSPQTTGSRVRCYYLVIPTAISEVTFIDSNGNVIYRCDYQETWLHGSTSYHRISEAVEKPQ